MAIGGEGLLGAVRSSKNSGGLKFHNFDLFSNKAAEMQCLLLAAGAAVIGTSGAAEEDLWVLVCNPPNPRTGPAPLPSLSFCFLSELGQEGSGTVLVCKEHRKKCMMATMCPGKSTAAEDYSDDVVRRVVEFQ